MKDNTVWHGVPMDMIEKWRDIFNISTEGLDLSVSCPVCGSATLHRYYQVGRPIHRVIDGKIFVAEGAFWEWCSTCKSYEHGSSLVPDWWNIDLRIDITGITAEPEVLEKGLKARNS